MVNVYLVIFIQRDLLCYRSTMNESGPRGFQDRGRGYGSSRPWS